MTSEKYLPPWATADEASQWLQEATGQPWPLARIVNAGAAMAIWVEPGTESAPEVIEHVFQGRTNGFMAEVSFSSDRERLAFARDGGSLTVFARPDGLALRADPPLKFPASELRFKGASLVQIAEACSRGASLGDQRKVTLRIGDIAITEESPGLAAFLELHGGPGALNGARLELLTFAPLPAANAKDGQAPAASNQPAAGEPDPARRLRLLRELGGSIQWRRSRWEIKGIGALEQRERQDKRARVSEKTIRKDLKEAAEAERNAQREGQTLPKWPKT